MVSEAVWWNAIQEGPSLKDRLVSGGEVGAAEEARMRELSLRRAKAEAAALEGASWGMQEDAEAEEEEVYCLCPYVSVEDYDWLTDVCIRFYTIAVDRN